MPAPRKQDLIDRVDDEDQVVGSVVRADALEPGVGFRVVHVLIQNSVDQLLLQRVGETGTRSPGLWGSSVAGYLFAGEEPLDGARRRMREEIGLTIPLKFVGRTRMQDAGSHKFIYVYIGRGEHASIQDSGHIADLRFWYVSDLVKRLRLAPDAFTPTLPYVLELAGPIVTPAS